MFPIAIATKGKGFIGALKRVGSISRRYGATPEKMDRMMIRFRDILQEFNGRATFPVVATALMRGNGFLDKHKTECIEFTAHGYLHIDHTRLSLEEQGAHFTLARHLFEQRGARCEGIRCPYLRWNEDTIEAIRQYGFLYESSQGLAWDVVDHHNTEAYRRVLEFYGTIPAEHYPSLPRWDNGLVRIPYCLPDDEAFVERLQLNSTKVMTEIWLAILDETYRLGELFTLGLHPERIFLCEVPLIETLRKAKEYSPGIWVARLDEIARWWKTHLERTFETSKVGEDEYEFSFDGPAETTILTRGVEVRTPVEDWDGTYQWAKGRQIRFRANRRPFIGISPSSASWLSDFLSQQGYIVESADDDQFHSFFLNRPEFRYEDERPLLAEIEQQDFPLVRFGRWPSGARSALSVTGDIDALTIWDYTLRLFGK